MPKTYKTALRILDEFYEWCTENQLTPTISRHNQLSPKDTNIAGSYMKLLLKPLLFKKGTV